MISKHSCSRRGEARSQNTDRVQLRMKTNSPNPTNWDDLLELVSEDGVPEEMSMVEKVYEGGRESDYLRS